MEWDVANLRISCMSCVYGVKEFELEGISKKREDIYVYIYTHVSLYLE